ncbi:Protein argonaute-2 [Cucumispora dikerogammari]|nr:Protein argonaute-2 [Cucumispora dikerogammari]
MQRSITLKANLFPLKITRSLKLFIHKISTTPEIRKAVQNDFLLRILSEHEITKNKNWAFDGSQIYVSEAEENLEFEVTAGRNTYKIKIELLEAFQIDSTTKALNETQMQALDLILRSYQNQRFMSCGRKQIITADSTTDRKLAPMPISGNVSMACGIVQATRFLQAGVFLNVDNALQAFYDTKPLIDMFREFEKIRKLDAFKTLLKSIRVTTIHLKKAMSFRGFGLSGPANAEMFEFEGKQVSVAEYFSKMYRPLQYPQLPCVQKRKGDMILNFPLEILDIAKNQKVNGQLNESQISDVIKITAKPPHERFQELKDKVKFMEVASNPLLSNLGIQVGTEFTKLEGKVLSPPDLKFADQRSAAPKIVKVIRGEWNLKGLAAIRPADFPACTIIDCANLPRNLIEEKFGLFKQTLRDFKINIGPHKIVQARDPFRDLDALIDGFCLVILPFGRENKTFYKMAKCISELHKQGALTQCIKDKNFKNMNPSLAANIALKMCIKKGGFPNFLSRGIEIFNKPSMVVGIDVSHPGIGQNVGTLAALVASIDKHCSKYATYMEFQNNRQEVLNNLNTMMVTALTKFKASNNCFPQSLIVFRDGVAASQFENICGVEMDLIKKAFLQLKIDCKLTYIVCQKKHSIRFCQENPQGPRGDTNAEPGTLILNANVMGREEFYMVSHRAMKGTARPVRYTVLSDENNFKEKIPKFIYDLCHMYGRCTKSVSVVSPVYFAHLAATRAKVYRDNQETSLVNDKDIMFYL